MARHFCWMSFIPLLVFSQQILAQGNNPQTTQTSGNSPSTTTDANAPSTTGTTQSATTGNTATSTNTSPTSAAVSTTSTGVTSTPPALSSTGTTPPLPTISGVLPPPLIVPDTSNAPFMQKSNLPEGTVFIAVGAALGFLGLCVLAWRGIVAWSLRRSVKRAAETAYAPDAKSIFGFGPHAGYKSMYNESNMSLEQLSASNTAYMGAGANQHRSTTQDRRVSKQPRPPSKVPASSSLFFSPTAGAGPGAGGATTSNRSSTFLPSGFYASNASAPGGGYGRIQTRDGVTPPDSPSIRPQSSHLRPDSSHGPRQSTGTGRLSTGAAHASHDLRKSRLSTSQNLNTPSPSTGRTPSALFDDLLENHGHGPSERF